MTAPKLYCYYKSMEMSQQSMLLHKPFLVTDKDNVFI